MTALKSPATRALHEHRERKEYRQFKSPLLHQQGTNAFRLSASFCGIMRRTYKDTSQRRRLIVGIVAILILGIIFWVTYCQD